MCFFLIGCSSSTYYEEKQSKEAVKKYGSTDSGALLGDILRPLLKKKSKKKE